MSSSYNKDIIQEPGYDSFPSKDGLYKKRLRDLLRKCSSYKKNKGWKKLEDVNGSSIFTLNIPDSGYTASMGRKKIKSILSPKDMIEFCHNVTLDRKWTARRKKLESKYVFYQSIYSFDKTSDLIHFRYDSGKRFISDRDFVVLRQRIHNEEKNVSYMYGGSIDTSKDEGIYPKCKKCVRGEVFCFMWTVKKPTPDTLEVEYFTHSSPGGMVPKVLFNSTVKEKALCVLRYTDEFLLFSKGREKAERSKRRNVKKKQQQQRGMMSKKLVEEERERQVSKIDVAKKKKQFLETKLRQEKLSRSNEKVSVAKKKRLEQMEKKIQDLQHFILKAENRVDEKMQELEIQQQQEARIEEEIEEETSDYESEDDEKGAKLEEEISRGKGDDIEEIEGEEEEDVEEDEAKVEAWSQVTTGMSVVLAVFAGVGITLAVSKYFAKKKT